MRYRLADISSQITSQSPIIRQRGCIIKPTTMSDMHILLIILFSSSICRWWGVLFGLGGQRLLVPVHPEPWQIQRPDQQRWLRARARPDTGDHDDAPRSRGHGDLHARHLLVGCRGHPEVRHRQARARNDDRRLSVRALRLFHERRLQECEYIGRLIN